MSHPKPVVIKRDAIPSVTHVVIDKKEHFLGQVRDLMKNRELADFLPKDQKVSFAWVRLEEGEIFNVHQHPIGSMLVICEGKTRAVGDLEADLGAGDIILVPPNSKHGFIGLAPCGFWGLSVQLGSGGIYEDLAAPKTTFLSAAEKGAPQAGAGPDSVIERLFAKNAEFLAGFDKHVLFGLVRDGLLADARTRARFLDCFQVWSNYFQRMVLARIVTIQHPKFEDLAWVHLSEELGHNRQLAKSRPDLVQVFDPILEATCAWFPWKISLISDAEKVVLVHLVVEASATIFYRYVSPVMNGERQSEHFEIHRVLDDPHVRMGYEFLAGLPLGRSERLFEVQEQGWSVLSSMFKRIAELVSEYAKSLPQQ